MGKASTGPLEAMNKEPFANVRKECVQVAVMAMRLALEGDPYLYIYRNSQGLDYSTSEKEVRNLLSDADFIMGGRGRRVDSISGSQVRRVNL